MPTQQRDDAWANALAGVSLAGGVEGGAEAPEDETPDWAAALAGTIRTGMQAAGKAIGLREPRARQVITPPAVTPEQGQAQWLKTLGELPTAPTPPGGRGPVNVFLAEAGNALVKLPERIVRGVAAGTTMDPAIKAKMQMQPLLTPEVLPSRAPETESEAYAKELGRITPDVILTLFGGVRTLRNLHNQLAMARYNKPLTKLTPVERGFIEADAGRTLQEALARGQRPSAVPKSAWDVAMQRGRNMMRYHHKPQQGPRTSLFAKPAGAVHPLSTAAAPAPAAPAPVVPAVEAAPGAWALALAGASAAQPSPPAPEAAPSAPQMPAPEPPAPPVVPEPAPKGEGAKPPAARFHGSPTPGLGEILPGPGDYGHGVYYATEKQAKHYARGRKAMAGYILGDRPDLPEGGNVYELAETPKNPLVLKTDAEKQALYDDALKTMDLEALAQKGGKGNDQELAIAELVKSRGHDALVDLTNGEAIWFRDTPVPVKSPTAPPAAPQGPPAATTGEIPGEAPAPPYVAPAMMAEPPGEAAPPPAGPPPEGLPPTQRIEDMPPERLIPESRALKAVMARAKKAATAGHKMGVSDKRSIDIELTERLNRLLPPDQHPKIHAGISKQIAEATTPTQVEAVTRRIVRRAVEAKPDVVMTEAQFHNYMTAVTDRSLKSGYRGGQLDYKATQQEVLDFAKATLPPQEWKAIATTLERILKLPPIGAAGRGAEVGERASVTRIIDSINRAVARHEHSSAATELKQAVKEADVKHLRPKEQAAVTALVDAFAFTKSKPATLARAMEILKVAARDPEGVEPPNRMVQDAIEKLHASEKPYIGDLDAEALRAMTRSVQELVHLSARKNKLDASIRHNRAEDMIQAASGEVDAKFGKARAVTTAEGMGRREEMGWKKRWTYGMLRAHETLVERLAGRVGTTHETLMENIWDGFRESLRMEQAGLDASERAFKAANVPEDTRNEWLNTEIEVPLEGAVVRTVGRARTVKMTRDEAMGLINNLNRASTRDELLRNQHEGITTITGRHPLKMTAESIRAVLEWAGTDPEGQALALLAKQHQEHMAGPAGEEVNARHVTERGWNLDRTPDYWTRRRDPEFRREQRDPELAVQLWRDRHLEDWGALKPTQRSNAAFVVAPMTWTFRKYMRDSSAYVHLGPALADARRLLDSRRFRDAVRNNLPDSEDVLKGIEASIRHAEGTSRLPKGRTDKTIRMVARAYHKFGLAGRAHIWAYQGISILNTLQEIDARHVFPAIVSDPQRARDARAFLQTHSPLMRDRFKWTYSLATPGLEDVEGKWARRTTALTFKPIQAVDSAVMDTILIAVENELGLRARDLVGRPADDPDVVRMVKRHDQIVRLTQPTRDPLTTSGLHQEAVENPVLRMLLTMFSSQRIKNVNQVFRAFDRRYGGVRPPAGGGAGEGGEGGQPPRETFGKFVAGVTVPTIVNALAMVTIKRGVQGAIGTAIAAATGAIIYALTGEEPKEKVPTERNAIDLVFDAARAAVSNLISLGEFPEAGIYAVQRGVTGRGDYAISPRTSGLGGIAYDTWNAAASLYEAASDIVTGAKVEGGEQRGEAAWKFSLTKALKYAADPATLFSGIPFSAAVQYGKGELPDVNKRSLGYAAGSEAWARTDPWPERQPYDTDAEFAARKEKTLKRSKEAEERLTLWGVDDARIVKALEAAALRNKSTRRNRDGTPAQLDAKGNRTGYDMRLERLLKWLAKRKAAAKAP